MYCFSLLPTIKKYAWHQVSLTQGLDHSHFSCRNLGAAGLAGLSTGKKIALNREVHSFDYTKMLNA